MDSTISLELQRHVGRYALGQVLGVGAFGEYGAGPGLAVAVPGSIRGDHTHCRRRCRVRLGQDLVTGDIVAVKIVAIGGAGEKSSSTSERLRNEVRRAARPPNRSLVVVPGP